MGIEDILSEFENRIASDLAGNLRSFRGEKNMIQCVRKDAKDLKQVLKLCRTGKWREASSKADCLDTIVRDSIPNKMWDLLTR